VSSGVSTWPRKQHLQRFDRHDIVWGVQVRRYDGRVDSAGPLALGDEDETLVRYEVFAQDELEIADSVRLTFGSKALWNDYTGWEVQPSARALWKPNAAQSVWAAVSRAARIPARTDRSQILTFAVIPTAFSPFSQPLQLRANPDSRDRRLRGDAAAPSRGLRGADRGAHGARNDRRARAMHRGGLRRVRHQADRPTRAAPNGRALPRR
jgi:hypothetical protein